MKRRDWLAGLAVTISATAARGLSPTAPSLAPCLKRGRVRWLVGYSAGGGYDAYSRLMEPYLEDTLGVEIVIDNIPGAAGRIAALTLARARPDGRTLGILDGSGLLWGAATQERNAVDVSSDFTILARLGGRQVVLAAGPRSEVTSLAELKDLARRRRVAFASTGPGSVNFVTTAVVTHVLSVDADFLVGYPGSREVALAVMRGDVDATVLDGETLAGMFGRGGLVPILSLGREQAPYVSLDSVPRLTGGSGVVERVASRSDSSASEISAALELFLDLGRLVAAPRLQPQLAACLRQRTWAAINSPRFHAAAARAGRSLELVPGERVTEAITASRAALQRLLPIAAAAARRAR